MLAMNWITPPRQQGGLLSSACSVEGDYRYLVWRQFYEKRSWNRRDGNEYQLQSDKSSVCVFCSCLLLYSLRL